MSRLLTDVADLAGYGERVTAPKYLETLHIAREYAGLLSVIACGFPTVALERGASSFATALHIRERSAKFPNNFLPIWYLIRMSLALLHFCQSIAMSDVPNDILQTYFFRFDYRKSRVRKQRMELQDVRYFTISRSVPKHFL